MPKLTFKSILDNFQSIPTALLHCLGFYLSPQGKLIMENLKQYIEIHEPHRIIFIGHSYNYIASFIPFYYINQKDKNCEMYDVDEFLNYFSPRKLSEKTVYCYVSHSGESPQIKKSIEKLIKSKLDPEKIWGVSENEKSFLARRSYLFFPTICGNETVVGTKSYINTILVLYFIARVFMSREVIPPRIEEEIRQLIFEIKFYSQDWEFHVKSLTKFLGTDYDYLYFISKGASLSTAYRGAYSIQSYASLYGEGTNLGLFLHGPFQVIQQNPESFRCVLILGDETNLKDTIRLIDMISNSMGSGKVMLINNSRELSSLGRSNEQVWVFEHTTKNPSLAPIFEIIVLQYLLLDLAVRSGVIS